MSCWPAVSEIVLPLSLLWTVFASAIAGRARAAAASRTSQMRKGDMVRNVTHGSRRSQPSGPTAGTWCCLWAVRRFALSVSLLVMAGAAAVPADAAFHGRNGAVAYVGVIGGVPNVLA